MTSEGLRDVNLSIKVPIISLISPSEESGAESTSTAEIEGIAGQLVTRYCIFRLRKRPPLTLEKLQGKLEGKVLLFIPQRIRGACTQPANETR